MIQGKVTGLTARKSIKPHISQKVPGGQCFPGAFRETAQLPELEYRLIRLLNRMAAAGICSSAVTVLLLLPKGCEEQLLRQIMKQLKELSRSYGLTLCQAEAVVSEAAARPMVVWEGITEFQTEEIPPETGDLLVQIGWMAQEGTLRLLEAHQIELEQRFCPEFLEAVLCMKEQLLMTKAAELARSCGAKALLPISEGGVFTGLWEAGEWWHTGLEVDLRAILVRQETIEICEFLACHPYKLAGGGCLLACVPDEEETLHKLEKLLEEKGIPVAVIGRLTKGSARVLHNREEVRYLDLPEEDELYRMEEMR